MKRSKTTWVAIIVAFGSGILARPLVAQLQTLNYSVDLNTQGGDLFQVRLELSGLSSENDIYQFAATAPGVYQVHDIGRYVRDFKALDAGGNEIASEM